MYNPKISWTHSAAIDVASYVVTWSLNGVAVHGGSVTQSSGLDTVGYSRSFLTDNPAVVLKDGDLVEVDANKGVLKILEKAK